MSNAAVGTPEVGLFKLPKLYTFTQDRLRSTMEKSLDSGRVYLAERLDDVLMRQSFWEDDIHVEDGALIDLEAYDVVASSIIRGFLDEIIGHLDEIDSSLSATNRTVSGSPRYVLTFLLARALHPMQLRPFQAAGQTVYISTLRWRQPI